MKKLICFVLCVVFVLSLTACGSEGNEKATHSIDIEYFVKLGQIKDFEYKLGDSIDDAKTLLSQTTNDHGESNYFDYPAGDYTVMSDGEICVCYKTDDQASGVTHIVKYGDSYGFPVGAVSTQVRDAMTGMGFTATERETKQGELFFMPSGSDMTILEYEIEGVTLLFVFQEHALSATVISKA